MTRMVVEKPFDLLEDNHTGRRFRPGVHEVDDKLLEHWFVKANGAKRAPDQSVDALPVEQIGGVGPYPVVEQTKNAEEGDIENTGAVPTSVNQGVKIPTPSDPNPKDGPVAPGPRQEAAETVANAPKTNADPKPGDRPGAPNPAKVDPATEKGSPATKK